ncbi:hypothetical protein FG05_35146 [Fusarium graminearum]|nr:hypothetical protein FG05_35146 [Fusarium graminearum]
MAAQVERYGSGGSKGRPLSSCKMSSCNRLFT